jgi:hypothetical protein
VKTTLALLAIVCMIVAAACSGGQSTVREENACQKACEADRDKCMEEIKPPPAGNEGRKEVAGPAEVSKEEYEKQTAEKQEVTRDCEAELKKCLEGCR